MTSKEMERVGKDWRQDKLKNDCMSLWASCKRNRKMYIPKAQGWMQLMANRLITVF